MPITVEDIKGMPTRYKVLLVLFLLLLIGYFYYFFFFQAAIQKKGRLTDKLETLERKIEVKERVARRIKQHKEEIAFLKEKLKVALSKLPEQKEIPGLLTSVSRAGIRKGLDFLLFQPMPPVPKDFYADIPVKITVIGDYHDIALFFESVAKLPRIVNITDIQITKAKKTGGERIFLQTNCVIKTYMFLEKKNENEKKKKKRKK